MNFKLLTTDDREFWNNYLFQLPADRQDIYYTPEYYSLYEKLGDGKAECFVFEHNGEIALYPYLINSINELGYNIERDCFDIQGAYGYNGVVSSCQAPSFVDAFYKSFTSYANEKNIIAEFSRFQPVLGNQEFSKLHMQVIFDRETVALNLEQSYTTIWGKEYSSRNRNMVRKAQKLGYSINIVSEPSVKEVEQFVSIYTGNMQLVDAEEYYYFNSNYFLNIFSQLKGNAYLFKVEDKKGNVVSS